MAIINYQLSMERQKIILLLFSVCLFAACSNEDEPINPPLVIRVTENPMTDATAPNNVARRGQVVDNSNFSAFTMRYGNEDTYTYTVTKSGSTWSTSPTYSPGAGEHTFYAFSAGTFYWKGGSPYIHFDVDAFVAPQKDLLVAKTAPITGNEVDLSFNHICSAVQFKICKTAAMADYVITVNTVDLCNVVNQGDYYFNTGDWSLESKTYYRLNTAPITLGTEATDLDLASGSQYLFMIPQTLEAWDKTAISSSTTGCYLCLNCTIQKGGSYIAGYETNHDAYLPIGGTWEKGKKYIITLNVGTALRNDSGTKITELL